uniref:Uncharacterized protein n=1 Tax=Arion vulgaris TaxID=1028688 RepID=A0A0B7B3F4_9EUPU
MARLGDELLMSDFVSQFFGEEGFTEGGEPKGKQQCKETECASLQVSGHLAGTMNSHSKVQITYEPQSGLTSGWCRTNKE